MSALGERAYCIGVPLGLSDERGLALVLSIGIMSAALAR